MRQSIRLLALISAVAVAASLLASAVTAASSRVSLAPVLSGYSRPVLGDLRPREPAGHLHRRADRPHQASHAPERQWRKLGTFLDLRRKVSDPRQGGNERGLLGLAFHPDYQRNGRFYVNYTRAGRGGAEGDTVVAEYRRRSAAAADPSSQRVLLTIDQPYGNHNGGTVAFGPDGYLYLGTGDGGSAGDPLGNGQSLATHLGKILRIDVDGDDTYAIPPSNPFTDGHGLPEIWAYGLRNPWRFSFDRLAGDLYIGDVGQGAREEVNRSRADRGGRNAGQGANYGWNRCEGKRSYPDTGSRCRLGTRPVHDYAHGNGRCSVTGGYVHRGPDASSWRGLYVAGDYCGRLFVLDGRGRVRLSQDAGRNLTSFGEDAAGRIYATDIGGVVYQVRFSGPRP